MRRRLFIKGNIDSSWAKLEFSNDEQTFTIWTSRVFDGLERILTALSLIKQGLYESEASLIDEPSEHVLHFVKDNSENIIINLYTFDKYKGAPLKNRIINSDKPKFSIETTVKRLSLQVLNLFDYFQKEYGLEGYKSRWGHDFPLQKLEKLRRL